MPDLSLCDAVDAIRTRKIGCEELLNKCVSRIKAENPRINAVLEVEADHALALARSIDSQKLSETGPLHGIPFGYKDMFHRAGATSSYGAGKAHWHVAAETSPLISAMELAGGVGFARLNMAEFAMGPTGHNATFGRCCNPIDPSRISGGSSSGSGAAVAAGFVFAALGSDTGGSVRLPASICGVVGLKPTQYLLPANGMMPLSPSLDCPGILARTNRDVARIFDVLTGQTSEAGLDGRGGGFKIGVPRDYYLSDLDDDINDAFQTALTAFTSVGCQVLDVDVPDQTDFPHLADVLWKSEAAALHRGNVSPGPKQLGRQVRARLAQGAGVKAVDYVDAQRLRSFALHRMLDGPLSTVDVLVMPTTPIMTPQAASVAADAGEEMRIILQRLSYATRPISFLGLPALSVPMGKDQNGMPMGLQIVGRPRAERTLLKLGHAFSSTLATSCNLSI